MRVTEHELEPDPYEALAARIGERFRASVAQRVPLRAAFVESLVHEARPAVHALLFAVDTDRATDPCSLEHHETTAMLTLLGRAFALDAATPTAAMLVVPLLLEAFRGEGVTVPHVLDGPLQSVFVEGYVRGREERIAQESERLAAGRVGAEPLVPGVAWLSLRGAFTAEALTEVLDETLRGLLRADAAACVVAVSGLEEPSTTIARLLGSFAQTAQGIGAKVRFIGDAAAFAPAIATIEERELRPEITADAARATTAALEDAGYALRRVTRLETSLRELVRQRITKPT